MEIVEAIVQYLFEETQRKKKYLVFNTLNRPYEYVLKEYEGELDEHRYWRVSDDGICQEIYGILKNLQGERQDRSSGQKIILCV